MMSDCMRSTEILGRGVDTATGRGVDTATGRGVDTAAGRGVDTAAGRGVNAATTTTEQGHTSCNSDAAFPNSTLTSF